YRNLYSQLGGSVITHPDILDFIHARKRLHHGYYARSRAGEPCAAVCRWGSWLAGDLQVLEERVQPDYDFREPEVNVPAKRAADRKGGVVLLKTRTLSPLSSHVAINSRRVGKQKNYIAMAKGYGSSGMSSKARYSRRRGLKTFAQAGGSVRSVTDFSPSSLA